MQTAHERGGFEREVRRVSVGADEAAGAELDAAEVARDDDGRIGQPLLLDRFEDWIARGTQALGLWRAS